ncbi:hypothetical protein EVAR_97786_1 [Eumeta japonica]|uniref:Uncharacterized protein n=1 Tax=Eumeta variegata TaxID=151549 RepID=A0A4C1XBE9_EUMVA|nr:hypothetical protein EVAR_97786_1 [Eumeta japonica]
MKRIFGNCPAFGLSGLNLNSGQIPDNKKIRHLNFRDALPGCQHELIAYYGATAEPLRLHLRDVAVAEQDLDIELVLY